MYAERNPPGDPPCATCKESAEEENKDALKIFFLVRNQLIMGQGGPIEINHQAIHSAMELYQIRNRRDCFEKVIKLSEYWINEVLIKRSE